MSDTNKNRLGDAQLDADLAHAADADKGDPGPGRIGDAPAPGAGEDADGGMIGEADERAGGGTPRTSVEGVDEATARRDAVRDATS